jgi:outer membrane biosynthesis protein TonB
MLHHAYLIKGWLLDKDPPAAVTEALEAIIGSLGREPNPVQAVQVPPIPTQPPAPAPDTADEQQEQAGSEPKDDHEPPAPARKKHNMSPEAREAARQRMIAMQARKRAEREAATREHQPVFTKEELRITVPAPRRKTSLSDGDWPEIKRMLAEGRSRAAIASDYDEDPEDLDFFISSCQRREARTPGEALAPLPGAAAGAARRT